MRLEVRARVYSSHGRGPLFDSGSEYGFGAEVELGEPERKAFGKARDVFREILKNGKSTGRFLRVTELESTFDQREARPLARRGRLQSSATY